MVMVKEEHRIDDESEINGGDPIERRYWRWIRRDFPQYQAFWSRFIYPATCRPESQLPHQDIQEPMQRLCMAHYSVYFHLGKAWRFHRNCKHMDDFFAHLSSVGDMTDQFLFSLCLVWEKLENDAARLKWREFSLKARTTDGQNYIPVSIEALNNLESAVKAFETSGKPVERRFLSVKTVAWQLVKAIGQDCKSKHHELESYIENNVTPYRNLLVHAPILGSIVSDDGHCWLPKADLLRSNNPPTDYRWWTKVISSSRTGNGLGDFVAYKNLAEQQFRDVGSCLKALWEVIIPWLEKTCADHPKEFSALCGSKSWKSGPEEHIVYTSPALKGMPLSGHTPSPSAVFHRGKAH